MCLKHDDIHRFSYVHVFYLMPFQDRLQTSMWEVLGGVWVHVETLWTSICGSAGNFFGDACAVEFMLDLFWILGGGWRSLGGRDFTVAGQPGPTFSDI